MDINRVFMWKTFKKVFYIIINNFSQNIGIYAVDYGNKSNRLAFGGGEGVVYVCSLVT